MPDNMIHQPAPWPWPVKESVKEIELLQSPLIDKLMPALIDASAEFDPVVKDSTNPHFRSTFASLSANLKAVIPALLKHRLMLIQPTTVAADGRNIVVTRVVHETGQWIAARWAITPVKQDPQGEGSALSYARRYTMTALLGLAAEDDDANAASAPPQARRQPAPQQAPQSSAPSSERDWRGDSLKIATGKAAAGKRKDQLLALMEECRGFGELDADLYKHFVALGKEINAEIAASVPA